ncbi:ABC transporter ATP-binding protein [Bradyrhizobium sp. U87765 SZCCT0131]|nr:MULTISPECIES: ABC transporter ATP-binding protein [unclassified Bradyrhizobium]MBR1218987.1 ABC transporter ATP-binding protein [Bradyrhizobium sp. U87765 SZCCT0131]MBR1261638.1 ABC transporter ATP-binding protein [Bradyrhizobium sp. U87765 SZCCT0134]MBR1306509.1 ABC transporter ATP-binding protein [Bradyrhizobium sp. U87765 SZCCT0110]MBR1317420.1 ABC transporter ATP-binding protein [Bradyrhizobium sp. U87765 SZCCT0109]MBR1351122.1 ABC transporter ATP-binding protein [Bradyrhizobium sp. U87
MDAVVTRQAVTAGRIVADGLSIRLGQGAAAFAALSDFSVTIEPGELVCILGPSGCGKSTLLGAIAGHLPATEGRLTVDDRDVTAPSPDRGIVFQHHTLFPWKKVRDNVAFGLKMRGVGRAERHAVADALLRRVGLAGFEAVYPSQLSGGMQQRVEIARVLINHPRVLLMDEPFGALDALTRARMHDLLLEIWSEIPTTTVFVTHDIDEALFLGDRVLMLSPRPGRIIADLRLDFPRPRSRDLLTDMAFVRLKRELIALLGAPAGAPPLPRLSPLGLPAA